MCPIYEEDSITEEPDSSLESECVTYEFEIDFDTNFNRNGLCRFMLEWTLVAAASLEVTNCPSSDYYITPRSFPSCTSSFNFNMAPDGVIQINIFILSSSLSDDSRVDVIVFRTNDDGSSTIFDEAAYSPCHENFVNNQWYTLEIHIPASTTSFTGYVSFKYIFLLH